MEQLDLVVIGAGTYGLAAAKQYHVSHPDHSLAVLDAYSTVGGVWSTERIYPGLKSNNLHGTYEYPDFPMTTERFGVKPREHVPGPVIHDYLEAYAREFGIDKHIRLNTKVLSAEHQAEGGWVVETKKEGDAAATKLLVKRLVVAMGQVSEPWMPHIKGQEEYGRPIFHSKDFREHKDTINAEKRVTVFGGTKSAWDAVYAYGTQGVKVDWIIRPTGHGPGWMSPPFVTPLKKWLEKLVNTRLLHWFGPCIWDQDSGYHGIKSFWHGTALGRAITNGFWSAIAADVIGLMGFDKDPELAKLKPTAEAMHTGTSFSILNYDTDFFEPIRNGTVRIHEADLSHLSEGKIHLDDAEGTVLESDAFLAVTGWKSLPTLKFLPEGIDRKIGLPYIPTANDEGRSPDEGLASRTDLLDKADAEIQERFPRLKVPMKFNPNYVPLTETKAFSTPASDAISAPTNPYTPMMLYHFMVPGTAEFLRTKDLAFAGGVGNFSNVICAHVQGLWISAFFDGTLARDPSSAVVPVGVNKQADTAGQAGSAILTLDEVHWQTVLHNRFGKWRYPRDIGARFPDFIFEAVPYLDMMMADMGLAVHRKNGWFNEITDPYGPEDYANINEEFATNLQAKQAI
ncbi:putative flavin-binding monooxygenase-like family protein [Phaeoacremonium minimum UCRPA7]|uniref:Putative flavin-binding monooxygenase-like family protein n=1 Tax=Phaeoacremonium minimum (strain UCR-PA7) TaxID=1286976 RepID=R8BDF8_PHAM7|nr:putative flavin-binding monooxygenase-like family protein [Phaeoacremonium minimum UCRPA7]EON97327.1 putative flavin-binding monooxygenase-like family protein [Phaeoacremonium minimum UCRPA7]